MPLESKNDLIKVMDSCFMFKGKVYTSEQNISGTIIEIATTSVTISATEPVKEVKAECKGFWASVPRSDFVATPETSWKGLKVVSFADAVKTDKNLRALLHTNEGVSLVHGLVENLNHTYGKNCLDIIAKEVGSWFLSQRSFIKDGEEVRVGAMAIFKVFENIVTFDVHYYRENLIKNIRGFIQAFPQSDLFLVQLLNQTDKENSNIFHCIAFSGSKELLQDLIDFCKKRPVCCELVLKALEGVNSNKISPKDIAKQCMDDSGKKIVTAAIAYFRDQLNQHSKEQSEYLSYKLEKLKQNSALIMPLLTM